jgi:o-succinylbenzoate synthase
MNYRMEFRPYRRRFRQPLSTSHGQWVVRSGILLRLTDESEKVSFGEIAPLAWFGSETWEQALAFCEQLAGKVSPAVIGAIPDHLPACQFGFESAIAGSVSTQTTPIHSALLPPGIAALSSWPALWAQGYRTFKWKIGVAPIAQELAIFAQLLVQLPPEVKIRLDANGGLTYQEAEQWLQAGAGQPIEFLEQPLPPSEFAALLHLSQQFVTPLALDESVATLANLETSYDQGWRGIFVIKPAIVGSPTRLRQFCRDHAIDAVFSTGFETAIGRQAGLQLAAELSQRAVGYGTGHWFNDGWDSDTVDFERLWQGLGLR